MAMLNPNLKYDHAFAVVRVDTFKHINEVPETAITVNKVVSSEEDAEVEVAHLNSLNKEREKGAIYFWQVTRLEPRSITGQSPGRGAIE